MLQLPAQLSADEDLGRSRLTVFFRLLLALPHLVWWYLWGTVASIIYLVVVIVAVINGALPGWAHSFYAAFSRYQLHLGAYLSLAANPYPGFIGEPGSYPVDAQCEPPAMRGRRPDHPFRDGDRPVLRPAAPARPDQHSAACGDYAVAGEFWDRDAHRADVDLDR